MPEDPNMSAHSKKAAERFGEQATGIWLLAAAGMLSGQWFGLCFYDGMDAGGTATTGCPPNRGAEWKHESPDFSRGENQHHFDRIGDEGMIKVWSIKKALEKLLGSRR